MMEFGGKSSFNLGLDSKIARCFLMIRPRNHKSAMVTKKKTCEVAVHFDKTPHDLSDFSFQCTDQVQPTVNNSRDIEKTFNY